MIKIKKTIVFCIILIILVNFSVTISASELEFEIDSNGNLKFQSASSDFESLGKTLSFAISPETSATSEDLKAIEEIMPGTVDYLNIDEETSGPELANAKLAIENAVYNNANYQFKSTIDSIKKLRDYGKINFRGGSIKLDDKGLILKKPGGADYITIPQGYNIGYEEKNRASFSLKADQYYPPKEFAKIGGVFGYRVKLERDAEFQVNPDSYGNIKAELKGNADIYASFSLLKSIKDGIIELDKNGDVNYAEFTANEKRDYKLNYKGIGYKFSAEKDGKIIFNPKKDLIRGEKASLVFGGYNDEGEFQEKTRIDINEFTIRFEDNKIKSINLNANGEFIDQNNVLVRIKSGDEGVNIFFDGKEHEGSYISFGEKDLFAETNEKETIQLKFEPDNPYVRIEENDYTSLIIYPDTEMSIKNRDEQEFIPEGLAKGIVGIYNDHKHVYVQGEDIFMERTERGFENILGGEQIGPDKDYFTNSPMEFSFTKKDGTPLLGGFKDIEEFIGSGEKPIIGNKIFFDNSYRLAIAPEEAEELIATYSGIDSEFSARIRHNYPTEEAIEILINAEIEFHGDTPKGTKDAILSLLRDYHQRGVSPEMGNSLKKLNIYETEELNKARGNPQGTLSTAGFANMDTGEVSMARTYFKDEILAHELGHTLHGQIRNKGRIIKHVLTIDDTPVSTELEYRNELDNFLNSLDIPEMEPVIKDGVYMYPGDTELTETEREQLISQYGEDWLSRPLDGYPSPYGAKNEVEYLAEFARHANNPDWWKQALANDNSYRETYWEVLHTLKHLNFYTEKQVNNILAASDL
jgi:hypothetical protein